MRTPSKTKRTRKERFRRGIYILPSLFTMTNLLFGFASIISAFRGRFSLGAAFIGIAFILDSLDGRIARLTKTTSPFGVEFDSLADLVSFGVAPAVIVYSYSLHIFGRVGWTAAFVFVATGAARLARFNIQSRVAERRYFVGLPIPTAACVIASIILFYHPETPSSFYSFFLMILVYSLSLLMVSKVRYRSFKDLDLRAKRSYSLLLVIAFVFSLFAVYPEFVFLSVMVGYASSGVITKLISLLRRARTNIGTSSIANEEEAELKR
ncbi:MAG: CDP-diacylglycerol--serine O-phosphatidyltransferase [Acidobacteria bacterium]|nr:CDP-diacylglycerol--serine O-phosphatidyltransferase [Acidobacteriota bacterium]